MDNSRSNFPDRPKLLADSAAREQRISELDAPHVRPLTHFVRSLRATRESPLHVPYFDPWDGGIHAELLYLLEAPGGRAVTSGFISRNNNDETAKNFFELNAEAGIRRECTVTWNIVPWYIFECEGRIRPAGSADIKLGLPFLSQLVALLPRLKVLVFLGRKAARAETAVRNGHPSLTILKSKHPGPLVINRLPENRGRILAILKEARMVLSAN